MSKISSETIKRMLDRLSSRPDFTKISIAFEILLEEQRKIEDIEARRHEAIMDSITMEDLY